MKKLKREMKGITLVTLVVTIIVLLILSGITISFTFGEKGIFNRAQEGAKLYENATASELIELDKVSNYIDDYLNEKNEELSETEKAIKEGTIYKTNTTIYDTYNNPIKIPAGFKLAIDSGKTVLEGVVIEDVEAGDEISKGNQFVWIPVGTIYKDTTKTHKSTIQLGRYTFNEVTGESQPVQLAYTDENLYNYLNEVPIKGYKGECIEVASASPGVIDQENHLNDKNATAKNLEKFINSVRNNGGYYIARYEASYGEGSSIEDWKPLSKVSIGNPRGYEESDVTLQKGLLWNWVNQLDASKICQNMYDNDESAGVESDLINSYAWDTAIVFIQEMNEKNKNYSNKKDGNGTLKNTGETNDVVCNIYDLAANLTEWTTEGNIYKDTNAAYPCFSRGGIYNIDFYCPSLRSSVVSSTYIKQDVGFRPILYM